MLLYVLEELSMGSVQTLAPGVRRVKGRWRALAGCCKEERVWLAQAANLEGFLVWLVAMAGA